MEPELKIQGLTVSLGGSEILHDLELTVHKGELLSLLGPSGCGKSTLLAAAAGLREVDRGSVCIAGRDVSALPPEKRGAVIVFQDLRLFPNLSVGGNIEFSMKLRGIPRGQRADRVRRLLELVQLPGLEKRAIHALSGGQLQRVALARALAAQPQLLLLDEPFSSLDEQLREEMRSLVQGLHKRLGTTIVLVTHDRGEALSLSDRIALMIDGRIIQTDTPQQIYRRPAMRCVSDYFGDCSYLQGRVTNGSFYHPQLSMAAPGCPDGCCTVRIPTSAVHLVHGDAWEIVSVRYQGAHSRIILQRGEAHLTAYAECPPRCKARCGVTLDMQELVLFMQDGRAVQVPDGAKA